MTDAESVYSATYGRLRKDDSAFKPVKVDRLLTGTARATGLTAKVIKRGGRTVTDWEATHEPP